MKTCVVIVFAVAASGCNHLPWSKDPQTKAEELSGYTYIPLDPFPVKMRHANCPTPMDKSVRLVDILEALPDNTARISTVELNQQGEASFTAGGVTEKGNTYKVTIDYTNSATVQLPLWIRKKANLYDYKKKEIGEETDLDPSEPASGRYAVGTQRYEVYRVRLGEERTGFKKVSIPLYVGVGLRVIAQVTALESKVNISGLGAISAGAEASALTGSLVVQTLGINGKSASAAVPVQSELNRTTVQSSIVAIGSIKSQLYASDMYIQPRVVGMYLPFPADQRLINAVISALADIEGEPVVLDRPCVPANGTNVGPGPSVIPPPT